MTWLCFLVSHQNSQKCNQHPNTSPRLFACPSAKHKATFRTVTDLGCGCSLTCCAALPLQHWALLHAPVQHLQSNCCFHNEHNNLPHELLVSPPAVNVTSVSQVVLCSHCGFHVDMLLHLAWGQQGCKNCAAKHYFRPSCAVGASSAE